MLEGSIMNRLSVEERAKILALLVEGASISTTCSITGTAKNTVLKLLHDVGAACVGYQDLIMRDLPLKKIECDEIRSFVGMKARSVAEERRGEFWGANAYTWTCVDADTKLVPCWHVGTRDAECARLFVADLASRLRHRVRLITDGHKSYLEAVEDALGSNIDYAMLIKIYGGGDQVKPDQHRCSPMSFIGIEKRVITGKPDMKEVSISYVARQNLTMHRSTSLTNAFPKKLENHMAAISLHFMHYNFCQIHKSLRETPAMAASIAEHVWSLGEVVMMADTYEVATDTSSN
jgi:IS1 family transposase